MKHSKKTTQKSTQKKTKNQDLSKVKNYKVSNYIDRDLSWLKFNDRVLFQAQDKDLPLLERVRFLTIFSSNLDEFYMKRVGELKRKVEVDPKIKANNGITLKSLFEKIRDKIINQVSEAHELLINDLNKKLREESLYLLNWSELSSAEKELANQYFDDSLFYVLTPLAYDSSHPFPFISNLSLSLGVVLKSPDSDSRIFARIKIPKFLPQWIPMLNPEINSITRYVSILDIVRNNLDKLFPGMQILASMPFRITRNADWDPDDKTESIVEKVEEAIKDRKFAECIRLQYLAERNDWIIELLKEILEIKEEDIYEHKFILDFCDLKILLENDHPKLKFKPWHPVNYIFKTNSPGEMFDSIAKEDFIVHHPYQSFNESVEKFIKLAATDPNVLAIKMTLYRTNDGSAFVKSLISAAESGKQVACLVELQARFDEERNLSWGNQLEEAGVHVVYGLQGYKIHTKTAIIVRKEADGNLKSYAHIGTGNYNSVTSNLYTDLGFFTTDKVICNDLVQLFHFLTGKSLFNSFQKLLVAPFNMKKIFLEKIQQEINHVKNGKEGFILVKVNSFDEVEIAEKLYEASQAGVKVKMFVRGFCTLRPKVKGLSENIEVFSIIGRFLEHSRIFYFKNGQDKIEKGDWYIGSADWMYRNLLNRVEVITPIHKKELRLKLYEIFETMLKDNALRWEMDSEGNYTKIKTIGKNVNTHDYLMQSELKNVH